MTDNLVAFPQRQEGPRFTTRRPIPLLVDGRSEIVKPGSTGTVIDGWDGSGPSVPFRVRALVRFDAGPEGEWDVDRGSLLIEDGS